MQLLYIAAKLVTLTIVLVIADGLIYADGGFSIVRWILQ